MINVQSTEAEQNKEWDAGEKPGTEPVVSRTIQLTRRRKFDTWWNTGQHKTYTSSLE